MDLATFTTDTLNYLWRPGDTNLQAAMPKIIRTAENRLRVDLKLTDSDMTTEVSVTTNPFEIPADVGVITNVTFPGNGPGTYTTPRDFSRAPENGPLIPGAIRESVRSVNQFEYTVEGNRIYHRQEVPVTVRLTYTPRPASLVDDDDTLFNEYTELYETAVYAEASDYLLNVERAADFNRKYIRALDGALTEQARRKFAGSPLKMSMPRRDVS